MILYPEHQRHFQKSFFKENRWVFQGPETSEGPEQKPDSAEAPKLSYIEIGDKLDADLKDIDQKPNVAVQKALQNKEGEQRAAFVDKLKNNPGIKQIREAYSRTKKALEDGVAAVSATLQAKRKALVTETTKKIDQKIKTPEKETSEKPAEKLTTEERNERVKKVQAMLSTLLDDIPEATLSKEDKEKATEHILAALKGKDLPKDLDKMMIKVLKENFKIQAEAPNEAKIKSFQESAQQVIKEVFPNQSVTPELVEKYAAFLAERNNEAPKGVSQLVENLNKALGEKKDLQSFEKFLDLAAGKMKAKRELLQQIQEKVDDANTPEKKRDFMQIMKGLIQAFTSLMSGKFYSMEYYQGLFSGKDHQEMLNHDKKAIEAHVKTLKAEELKTAVTKPQETLQAIIKAKSKAETKGEFEGHFYVGTQSTQLLQRAAGQKLGLIMAKDVKADNIGTPIDYGYLKTGGSTEFTNAVTQQIQEALGVKEGIGCKLKPDNKRNKAILEISGTYKGKKFSVSGKDWEAADWQAVFAKIEKTKPTPPKEAPKEETPKKQSS